MTRFAAAWVVGNDSCPTGYRVSIRAQLTNLNSQPNVWVASGNTVSGLGGQPGRIYGPGAIASSFNAAAQIFLPAAGYRNATGVHRLDHVYGRYYSSPVSGTNAYGLYFTRSRGSMLTVVAPSVTVCGV